MLELDKAHKAPESSTAVVCEPRFRTKTYYDANHNQLELDNYNRPDPRLEENQNFFVTLFL